MLDKNAKDLCKQSVDVFTEIFNNLCVKYPIEYSYEIASQLTQIVFIAIVDS